MFDTPIGDLSPVFETDFGYHFLAGNGPARAGIQRMPRLGLTESGSPGSGRNGGGNGFHCRRNSTAATWNLQTRCSGIPPGKRPKTKVSVSSSTPGTAARCSARMKLTRICFSCSTHSEPGAVSEPIQLTDEDEQGYWIAVQLMERVAAHRANPTQDFGYFQTIVEDGPAFAAQLDGWILRCHSRHVHPSRCALRQL